ncbi:MAG: flavodoxin family protein [Candidatus Hodarchaeota archaeon]
MNIKVVGISGSPRKNGNTEILVKEALNGAQEIRGVQTTFRTVAGKEIRHCTGCLSCRKKGLCVINDDFIAFFKAYMEADGIIMGSPVYHLSITSCLKAVIDRLGQVMFSTYQGKLPRLCKVGGVITQGGSIYGGQEFTLQFMINSFILENCVVVSGDSPQSKIGVPASTFGDLKRGSIRDNENAILLSRSLGRRVGEMAKIIKTGLRQLRGELGPEYFATKHLKKL